MTNSKKVIVLGGGLTGLAAAWKLAKSGTNVTVVEIRDSVGGLASTFSWRGFELDIGPHTLYSQSEDIRNFVISILGRELDRHWKKAGLWFRGRWIEFPLSIRDAFINFSWLFSEHIRHPRSMLDYLRRRPEVTYRDYVLNRFGFYLYEELFRPQATKLWGPPEELSVELGHVRMPFPNIYSAAFGTIWKKLGRVSSAEKFFYPKKGIGELSDRLAHDIVAFGGKLELGRAPHEINLSNNRVTISLRDEKLKADVLISTIAPDSFFRILQPEAPPEIVAAAERLKFRSLIMCYLAISRPKVTTDHWINFPEAKYSF
ncbi:MAG: FAD-dependent oxidoreductase, partial [Actinomycetia bacterium]|nr:FAD-dependent oxidoreductase [Actinomycetes bacterium]